jgi:leader peptidase (prepilin peptidase)/N-methyltransferase
MWDAAFMAALAGIAGAVAGSFCATAALRFAAGESPWSGRSRCDGCARALGWVETVPFVGFVRSGGACTVCHRPIDRLHLWGEGLGAAAAATAVTLAPDLSGIVLALIGLVLLAQGLIDIRTLRLPDAGNAIVAGLCGGLALLRGQLVLGLIAAVAAGVLLFALKAWLERRRGQTMLGVGDIKLIAALALGLGAWTPYMIAVAAVTGLAAIIVRRMKGHDRLPFGPFIAVAGFILLLAGGFSGAPL